MPKENGSVQLLGAVPGRSSAFKSCISLRICDGHWNFACCFTQLSLGDYLALGCKMSSAIRERHHCRHLSKSLSTRLHRVSVPGQSNSPRMLGSLASLLCILVQLLLLLPPGVLSGIWQVERQFQASFQANRIDHQVFRTSIPWKRKSPLPTSVCGV